MPPSNLLPHSLSASQAAFMPSAVAGAPEEESFDSIGVLASFRGVSKRYAKDAPDVLQDLDLDIREGEFLSILGPSGSGKTTCLMLLAGLQEPSGGEIHLRGNNINTLAPRKRNFGVVFQNYALFPNLTVEQNVQYPLRARGVARTERTKRARAMLAMVRLEGFEDRRVQELSGGERQRVALARALVFEPDMVLMDEPMSALDRELRAHMQMELRALHQRLGITFVAVTHDQDEAFSMSDRVAVLDHGRLQQVGAPESIYAAPANRFVANFVGEGNELTGVLLAADGRDCLVLLDIGVTLQVPGATALVPGARCAVFFRTDRVTIATNAGQAAPRGIGARVVDRLFVAGALRIVCETAEGDPSRVGAHLTVKVPATSEVAQRIQVGGTVDLLLDPDHLTVFAE